MERDLGSVDPNKTPRSYYSAKESKKDDETRNEDKFKQRLLYETCLFTKKYFHLSHARLRFWTINFARSKSMVICFELMMTGDTIRPSLRRVP